MGRWVGVDYGTRRIGLALGDPTGSIASPAGVLSATGIPGEDARAVRRWVIEHEGDGIVVGLPLNMDGTESVQSGVTRAFATELRGLGTLPVELWDERLSSYQADLHLSEAGLTRSRRRRHRDALAAQVVLQSFLDARRDRADGPPP